MISPHTIPGTKVICIESSGIVMPGQASTPYDMVRKDEIYTVSCIVPELRSGLGFAVELQEKNDLYDLRKFRYLELPRSITSALTSQPLVTEREREVAA